MTSHVRSTSSFMAKLLSPVPGIIDRSYQVDLDLVGEVEEISEAKEKVDTFTARRDTAPFGSRERAVAGIILDWWQRELNSLVGGLA